MPLKYYCPKCSKRYVDWGAEKLAFKCPDCDGETLYRVGTQPEGEDGKPSLSKTAAKRKTKAKAKAKAKPKAKAKAEVAPVEVDDDLVLDDSVPDLDDVDSTDDTDVVIDDD